MRIGKTRRASRINTASDSQADSEPLSRSRDANIDRCSTSSVRLMQVSKYDLIISLDQEDDCGSSGHDTSASCDRSRMFPVIPTVLCDELFVRVDFVFRC